MTGWKTRIHSFHPPPFLFLRHQGLTTKPGSPLSWQASRIPPPDIFFFLLQNKKKLFLTVYFPLYREIVIPGVAIIDLGKMEHAPTFGLVTTVIINAMHYGGRGIAMIIERDRLGRMLGR